MQRLFQKEKKNILTICFIEVLLTVLVFLNYYFGNVVKIPFPSEYVYTILVASVFVINVIYLIAFYSKIDSLNDINTKKTNFVLTNNVEDIFSFTESGIIFYDDDFNVVMTIVDGKIVYRS